MQAKKETICVHAGNYLDEKTGGINTPIFPSTSYLYDDTGEIIYPRHFNTPNQLAIIEKMCELEKGEDALVLSSGMAAISSAIMTFLSPGDHIIFTEELYGGIYHFIEHILERNNMEFSMIPNGNADALEKMIRKNTRLFYLETPSNPLLKITDLREVSRICRKSGVITIIDNTFATPINQNPLELGIDIVVHSGTKYLGGHHDLIFGVVVSSKDIIADIKKTATNYGGSVNAGTCHQIERSLKTLAIRVNTQNTNAMNIARYLSQSPYIKEVFYPGLETHKNHAIAAQQMSGFGGVVTFTPDVNRLDIKHFIKNFKYIREALSLGGLDTIFCMPYKTSHKHLTDNELERLGISKDIIRLSTGIENYLDLISDIETAVQSSLHR
jgi:cystathionine beta-lyase/cystathionine gamma-synthase